VRRPETDGGAKTAMDALGRLVADLTATDLAPGTVEPPRRMQAVSALLDTVPGGAKVLGAVRAAVWRLLPDIIASLPNPTRSPDLSDLARLWAKGMPVANAHRGYQGQLRKLTGKDREMVLYMARLALAGHFPGALHHSPGWREVYGMSDRDLFEFLLRGAGAGDERTTGDNRLTSMLLIAVMGGFAQEVPALNDALHTFVQWESFLHQCRLAAKKASEHFPAVPTAPCMARRVNVRWMGAAWTSNIMCAVAYEMDKLTPSVLDLPPAERLAWTRYIVAHRASTRVDAELGTFLGLSPEFVAALDTAFAEDQLAGGESLPRVRRVVLTWETPGECVRLATYVRMLMKLTRLRLLPIPRTWSVSIAAALQRHQADHRFAVCAVCVEPVTEFFKSSNSEAKVLMQVDLLTGDLRCCRCGFAHMLMFDITEVAVCGLAEGAWPPISCCVECANFVPVKKVEHHGPVCGDCSDRTQRRRRRCVFGHAVPSDDKCAMVVEIAGAVAQATTWLCSQHRTSSLELSLGVPVNPATVAIARTLRL
jgi:hypothetical protein